MVLACGNNRTKPDPNNKNVDTIAIQQAIDSVTVDKPSIGSFAPYFVEQKNGDVLWIQTKNALSADQQGIYVYFQNDNSVAKNLRLRIQYGETSYKFVCDGKTCNYAPNRSKSSDSRFVEGEFGWYDDYVKSTDLKFLETLAASNEAKLILGDGQTLVIDSSIKSNIKRTLDYFEAMDGLLPKSNMVNIRRL